MEGREQHREIAVFVHVLAPDLAFLLELLDGRRDRGHQLHDDRGGDVGRMPSAKIDMRSSAPPANMLNMPMMPPAFSSKICAITTGSMPAAGCRCRSDRPIRQPSANQTALLELGRLAERAKIDVGGELLGHRCPWRPPLTRSPARRPPGPRRPAGAALRGSAGAACRRPSRQRPRPWTRCRPRSSAPSAARGRAGGSRRGNSRSAQGRAQGEQIDQGHADHPAAVDRGLQAIEIEQGVDLPERVLEAVLGQPPVDPASDRPRRCGSPAAAPARARWPLWPRPRSCRYPSRCRDRHAWACLCWARCELVELHRAAFVALFMWGAAPRTLVFGRPSHIVGRRLDPHQMVHAPDPAARLGRVGHHLVCARRA